MKHTNSLEFLNKKVTVKMDRPLGSKHPRHGFKYKLNYGFIPNTLSPDGEELDAYVLGIDKPLETFTGICIAIIQRTNDDDDKLIVVPENKTNNFSNADIEKATHFQEQFFKHIILR